MMKLLFTILLCLPCCVRALPPEKAIDFTTGMGKTITASRGAPKMSRDKQIFGKKSLLWDWQAGDRLTFAYSVDTSFNRAELGHVYAPAFKFYLYNTRPNNKSLSFQFFSKSAEGKAPQLVYSFEYQTNFTGWRTATVRYTDMQQHAQLPIDYYEIHAPDSGSGAFYFSTMIPSMQVYQAIPMADQYTPFMVDGEDEHRGPGAQRRHLDMIRLKIPSQNATAGQRDLCEQLDAAFKQRILDKYRKKNRSSLSESIQKLIGKFGFSYDEKGNLQGSYIIFRRELGFFPKELKESHTRETIGVQNIFWNLLPLAVQYTETESAEDKLQFEKFVLALYKLMKEQGWVSGHARGSLHNTGYNVKPYSACMYLTLPIFEKNGLRQEAAELMQWLTNAREVLMLPKGEHTSSLDYFHTYLHEQMMAILMEEKPDDRATLLKFFAQSFSMRLAQNHNNHEGGFKDDGTAFHHFAHYPNYAWGALNYASDLVALFDGTPYAVSPQAHANIKRALLTTRLYSNTYDLPNHSTGRHPFSRISLRQLEPAFWNMAKVGPVDQSSAIDPGMAAAYLRLFKNDREKIQQLESEGFKAENSPEGFWALNNAGNAILRRDQWMVSFKGYNKEVWYAEAGTGSNRFGAFFSHGAMEIVLKDGYKASGFQAEGWDWSRLPGTTAIHMPHELIALQGTAHGHNKHSLENFTGAVSNGRHGVFAQKIRDDMFVLKAKKSYFCFDNRVIALGSDIHSRNAHYPAETTLFQNALADGEGARVLAGSEIKNNPTLTKTYAPGDQQAVIARDTRGNIFVIKEGKVHLRQGLQQSHDHNTGQPNKGGFATCWIDHGRRIKGEKYNYGVLIQPGFTGTDKIIQALDYDVIQHDSTAHIVHDKSSGYIGAAVFESGSISHPQIKFVSHASIILSKMEGGTLELNLCEPDLKWEYKNARTSVLIKLQGDWRLTDTTAASIITYDAKNDLTYLEVICNMARTSSIKLSPSK
ncbi:MAG: hypothetical protein H7A51_18775 [Akkermansiaceae bacterium]|nr:hypothetical protein [Akkermansiaceae bacterium]